MQLENLLQGIASKFEKSRIVLWYDPEQSFTDEISNIDIEGTSILDMANESLLETKKLIEIDNKEGRFLLYFSYEEPDPENDWMLDVRLYSEQFFADHSSMLLNELGISKMSLRGHIRQRVDFFASKQRLLNLQKWVTENEDEQSIDRKMIAVIVKADSASIADILLSLFKDYADHINSLDSNAALSKMKQLLKFGLAESLWNELLIHYSYQVESPSIQDFVLKMFCTDLWSQITNGERDWLLKNVLKTASGRATAQAFMVNWRDSRSFSESYDVISSELEDQLEIAHKFSSFYPIQLVDCETFGAIEQSVIRGLIRELLDSSHSIDQAQFDRVISQRLASHWCHTTTRNGKEYFAIYKAIQSAAVLLHLRQQYVDGFHYSSAIEMYQAYEDDLYKFDQAYRLFNEFVYSVHSKGADVLRKLDDEIEGLYSNWFLYELGLAWDRCIAQNDLINNWSLPNISSQYDFFDHNVLSVLKEKQIKRVFVVVSDALRYEVAHELSQTINDGKRFKAELSSQLGVLPSYTQLGMAALLPSKSLSYSTNQSSVVLADGKSTQGLDNRGSILNAVNGMAVSSKELMAWSNQEGRDSVRNFEIVYIYHDTIDAIGDKLSTEEKTFEACRDAVNELKDLVGRVINRLNASRVLITADHGFLFQQKALEESDKTTLLTKPQGAFEAKKRYILGNDLPSDDSCWKGSISKTAKGNDNTEFLLPKSSQRFHFMGGARFVHGGAMLQEVCVPVIKVSALRDERAKQYEKKPVGVVAATQSIKMVNNIDKIRFIQTEAVGDDFIPRQLDVFIINSANVEVSSRETISFDSTSESMDDRTRDARLKLIGSSFNRNEVYYLVLENVVTHTEYNKYVVTIDLAIQDDFF